MAKKQLAGDEALTPETGEMKARLLVDCDLGKCNDVVLIEATAAESLIGVVDTDPAAIEYAESLVKE